MKIDNHKLINPMDVAGETRLFYYEDLPLDLIMEFEFVCWYKAHLIPYAKHGAYLFITSISLLDYPELNIIKNEMLILQFAYITFTKALMLLPVRMRECCSRKVMDDHDNVYIKFKKIAKKKIKILELERRKGDMKNMPKIDRMYKVL